MNGTNGDIKEILLGQHKILKKEMAMLKEEAEKEFLSFEIIFNYLQNFKYELTNHLHLENDVFYPQLLEKLKNQGMDIVDTIKFIDKMKEIEKNVLNFTAKYAVVEDIKNKTNDFKPDLNGIISTLLIRLESEEDGVYMYW